MKEIGPLGEFIFCDFNDDTYSVKDFTNQPPINTDGYRNMDVYIRSEVLMMVVNNFLSWEDFSIGLQARISRTPNNYESAFWYHFKNV